MEGYTVNKVYNNTAIFIYVSMFLDYVHGVSE